jgi:hypothetical protein
MSEKMYRVVELSDDEMDKVAGGKAVLVIDGMNGTYIQYCEYEGTTRSQFSGYRYNVNSPICPNWKPKPGYTTGKHFCPFCAHHHDEKKNFTTLGYFEYMKGLMDKGYDCGQ